MDNVDLWLGNTERKLDVKARRILITHWVGEAYQRLMGDEYAQTWWRSFEKTGCLITADGSEDHKINPEGLPNYVVPPPLPMTTSQEPMECAPPEPAAEPEDILPEEEPEPTEVDIDTSERVDDPKDRVFDHCMINREIRGYYDGWYIGRITWYNTKLGEYRVLFKNKSEDYITLDDIDGLQIILVD